MKSLATALALGIVALQLVVHAAPRAASAVGYLSMQRLLSESKDAQVAAKRLESVREARMRDVNARKKALDQKRLELANAGGLFGASRRAQLAAEVKKQEAELEQAAQQAQTELQDLQRRLQASLRQELSGVVAEVARRRSIDIVLNGDTAVVWAPSAVDLTAEVLERLNAAAAERPAAK